ncbi:MAG TPA: transcription-repair coupling factor [Firmicutes bacterium]|nr:transcription-repair coupling factor [Candidatus Fermentithermobacillaceae bacterium]
MPHPGLLDLFSQSHSAAKVLDAISAGKVPLLIVGAQGYARTIYTASIYHRGARPIVAVFSRPEEAVTAKRDLSDLVGPDNVVLFPAREVMPFETKDNQETLWLRISCLHRLCVAGKTPLIITLPATALVRRLMSEREFRQGCTRLFRGMTVSPEDILKKLIEFGYERVPSVETRGQVAVRGGIMDVFPPVSEYPYRMEFFNDEIDSIRVFDPETQISTESLEEAWLSPARDDPGDLQGDSTGTILEYLPEDSIIVVDEYERCVESIREFEKIGLEIASARMVAGTMDSKEASIYFHASYLESLLKKASVLYSTVLRNLDGVEPKEVLDSETTIQVGFSGRWNDLATELKELVSQRKRVVILAGNRDRLEVLRRWLEKQDLCPISAENIEESPPQAAITLTLGSGENGFNCDSVGLSLFTETEVYGRPKVRQTRRRTRRVSLDWRDLLPGDYVVHVNHGVGQFMGIKTMTVNGVTRDYLYIRYAGNDALYVPTDQVHMVERYVGPQGEPPTLQRLGTGDWQRIKARVKKSIEDMARKLIMLEAKRKSRKGHAFSKDTPWQRQFEEAFEYEDTEDQARATEEIKRDMEDETPMDRLLCGDVGYGKTEVAMRAAFKAVMDSKQVAVLVPTTILAEQHFSTFSRRFSDYPVTIQVLSRFRSAAEQKRILKDLEAGAVDIIIGTHRLLSKDVKFKDLGLLIVDEEHRFGVAQKERLKEISETCDVLTLTATPIPRTLNMALSGIRDISVIETPPEGRFPVETYVVPYNPSLISQAIRREMRRGGQVFYVYNRVHSIHRVYSRLQSIVPEARIAVAHGKMRDQELSRTMQDFLQGRYDILVSTTIIESGLDLPNVNTLIVEDADKLGLAQLYQLRGRVGRSNRIAYAYFTYRPDKNLTVEAEERLNALRDFAAMGSGFKLAMRDMEIRGAGNLLGAEQHGFMTLVGYDMYIRLLEKAVRDLKGEKEEKSERISTAVEIPCDAYIPETYIEDPRERFAFYKRIAGAEDVGFLDDVEFQLQDRYGDLPRPVVNLLDVARLKVLCGSLGVTQVSFSVEDLVLCRQRLTFKIEVPHLFPYDKVPHLKPQFPGVELDQRSGILSVSLIKESPETALKTGLALVRQLCG